MSEQDSMNAQCFAKRGFVPLFTRKENMPQLLYACHVRADFSSKHPRIMHSHPDLAELVLIYNGSGRYMIQNKRYHVEKGDLLIYNADTVHDEVPVPDSDLAFFTIAVGSLQMPGLKKNALIAEELGCRFATGRYFDDLYPLFQIIFRNLQDETFGAEQFCGSLLHALISKVNSMIEEQVEDGTIKLQKQDIESPSILSERVAKYISDNYMNPITIQDIASELNASPYYIAHVFKEETGYSPIQYLLRRRIGESQTLLISTNIPIVDIAGAVGYETQSYFTTQFTKYVGMPPKQFRQKYKT